MISDATNAVEGQMESQPFERLERPGLRIEAEPPKAYQTLHWFAAGRTIASPSLQENACRNSGMLLSGPTTR